LWFSFFKEKKENVHDKTYLKECPGQYRTPQWNQGKKKIKVTIFVI
jgi:hypothetical protein